MRDLTQLAAVAGKVVLEWRGQRHGEGRYLWPGLEGALDALADEDSEDTAGVAARALCVAGEWWQPDAAGGDVPRLDRARARVWLEWPELAELLGWLVAAGEGARSPVPPVGSAPVVGPLDRVGRAAELLAVTAAFRALAPSDVRERAWRAMGALVQGIEGDACGPQDVVGR